MKENGNGNGNGNGNSSDNGNGNLKTDSAERKASAEKKQTHWQRELTRCKQAEGVGQASLEGRDRPLFCIVFDAPRIGGSVV